MASEIYEAGHSSPDYLLTHPLDSGDVAVTAAMHAATRAIKGVSRGIEARDPFDALMEGVLAERRRAAA
jgi:hypothetical protein